MLHGDEAQPRFGGEAALGGQAAPHAERAGDNVAPKLPVQLQIGALTAAPVNGKRQTPSPPPANLAL